jgi:hypothetical protein
VVRYRINAGAPVRDRATDSIHDLINRLRSFFSDSNCSIQQQRPPLGALIGSHSLHSLSLSFSLSFSLSLSLSLFFYHSLTHTHTHNVHMYVVLRISLEAVLSSRSGFLGASSTCRVGRAMLTNWQNMRTQHKAKVKEAREREREWGDYMDG